MQTDPNTQTDTDGMELQMLQKELPLNVNIFCIQYKSTDIHTDVKGKTQAFLYSSGSTKYVYYEK